MGYTRNGIGDQQRWVFSRPATNRNIIPQHGEVVECSFAVLASDVNRNTSEQACAIVANSVDIRQSRAVSLRRITATFTGPRRTC